MNRKGWSYKEDRRLSELAGSGKTLEQIAKAMDRTPDGIRNRGAKNMRLSLLTPRTAKPIPSGLVWRKKATFFT